MAYTPPSPTEINFALVDYSPPVTNAIDFNISSDTATSDNTLCFLEGYEATPVTNVLDNFNRADENPLTSTTWGGPMTSGGTQWQIVTNKAHAG